MGKKIIAFTLLLITANAQAFFQQVAIPSYFYPCTGPSCYWTQLNNSSPRVGIALINPNSGVGNTIDPNYVATARDTQAKGITVLGYVYTNYGQRNLIDVRNEVDKYYSWYHVDGIFFDQGAYDCGHVNYYQILNNYVKSKCGKAFTVINYGGNTQECTINSSDVSVVFEDTYAVYKNWFPSPWYGYYPAKKFWHIVYNVAQSSVADTMMLSKRRNAGYIYLTNDGSENPYDTLPPENYWNLELSLL